MFELVGGRKKKTQNSIITSNNIKMIVDAMPPKRMNRMKAATDSNSYRRWTGTFEDHSLISTMSFDSFLNRFDLVQFDLVVNTKTRHLQNIQFLNLFYRHFLDVRFSTKLWKKYLHSEYLDRRYFEKFRYLCVLFLNIWINVRIEDEIKL